MMPAYYLVAGLVGALVVAIVYLTLAANAEANHEDRVLSVPPIGRELDAFLRALHGTAGECVVEGNAVELFQNGDEIFPPMLAAIRESQSTIHFSTYIYWAGAMPREFATALADAARRGVIVRLVLDSEGTKPMPRALVHQMRDAGCQLTWFRPIRWFDSIRVLPAAITSRCFANRAVDAICYWARAQL
jgi:cardiolipin synthase